MNRLVALKISHNRGRERQTLAHLNHHAAMAFLVVLVLVAGNLPVAGYVHFLAALAVWIGAATSTSRSPRRRHWPALDTFSYARAAAPLVVEGR
ncbi:MAG TPA: hypothetical protein VIW24_17410 [Aldersonia sp.]